MPRHHANAINNNTQNYKTNQMTYWNQICLWIEKVKCKLIKWALKVAYDVYGDC